MDYKNLISRNRLIDGVELTCNDAYYYDATYEFRQVKAKDVEVVELIDGLETFIRFSQLPPPSSGSLVSVIRTHL